MRYLGFLITAITISWPNDKEVLELPELIVSNSKVEERRAEAPISITVLSEKDLEKTRANSLHQVLNQTPGVYVSDLGSEQHFMAIRQPISTKGYFLYLEDGIPIRPTGVFNHNALLEINMAGLERIEVVRGPSSSLYGSEAVGGAINFITQNPTSVPEGKVALRVNDLGYHRVDGYHSNTQGKVGYAVGGHFAERSEGPREHSDYEKLSFNGKLKTLLSEELSLTASLGYIDYRSDMTGSLDSANYFEQNVTSLQTFTEREVNALRGRLTLVSDWSSEASTQATVFYRGSAIGQIPSYRVRDDYKPWAGSGDPTLAHGETNINDVQGVGTFVHHIHKIPNLNIELIGGLQAERSANTLRANYIQIQKDSISGVYTGYTSTDSVKTNYEADLLNVAPYGQLKWTWIDNLHLTASARYDYFSYDYVNFLSEDEGSTVPNTKTSFQHFSPKLGSSYEHTYKNIHLGGYVNFSQGFVPPQISELYRSEGNPELKPAVFDSYELGTWLSVKSWATIEGAVYYIEGKDEIISVILDNGSRQNQNAGRTGHRGIEWGVQIYPITWLRLRFNGSYAEHEYYDFTLVQKIGEANENVIYDGNDIEQAPNWLWNSALELTPNFLPGFLANLEWQHVGNYWMDPSNTKEYKGHDLFHLRTSWNVGKMQFWVHVLNLLDTHYATSARTSPWGERYNLGEGRSINMGLSYSFDGASQ